MLHRLFNVMENIHNNENDRLCKMNDKLTHSNYSLLLDSKFHIEHLYENGDKLIIKKHNESGFEIIYLEFKSVLINNKDYEILGQEYFSLNDKDKAIDCYIKRLNSNTPKEPIIIFQ